MAEWIKTVMDSLGYSGVALLMFLETIFPPIPSEVVIPMAGFTASSGALSLTGVVAAGAAGSLTGAAVWYAVGRVFGGDRLKRLAKRHGIWIGISERDVESAMAWFGRYGRWAVLIGRAVPGLPTLISVPAGVCGMPFPTFLAYSTLGTLGWTLGLAYAGVLLQDNWHVVGDYAGPIGYAVLGLVVAWVVVRFLRHRARAR